MPRVRAVIVREQIHYRVVRPARPGRAPSPPPPDRRGGGGWFVACCIVGGLVVLVGKLAGGNASLPVNSGNQETAEIDDSGHCHVTAWGAVSGRGGNFSAELDSGAGASLWLTREDAARIGFKAASLHFNRSYRGVSGPGWSAYVEVPQLRLGGVTFSDVPAFVVSENDGTNTSLVGLPILKRLNYRVVGNACVLSW